MLLVEEIVAFSQSERPLPPLTWSYSSRHRPQGLGVRTGRQTDFYSPCKENAASEGCCCALCPRRGNVSPSLPMYPAQCCFLGFQGFQEQVNNFSLLLACLGWDVRAIAIKIAGV